MTEKRDRLDDKELREKVLARDKKTCRMCNKKKSKLEIHHIKRWADAIFLRYDPTNCITLCKQCHYSIRNKEKHYESYFYEILRRDVK